MTVKKNTPFLVLALVLAGCGPSGDVTGPLEGDQPPGESPPLATTGPQPDVAPLEWLAQMPFEAGGEEQPDILPPELPEGFNALEPEHGSVEVEAGFVVFISGVSFERPIGGQVSTEDYVTVNLNSYDVPEGRAYHFDLIAEKDFTWQYVELDGHYIARYYNSSVDGRMWISGPYLVGIHSGLDTVTEAPWVDDFASLFLAMFPPN